MCLITNGTTGQTCDVTENPYNRDSTQKEMMPNSNKFYSKQPRRDDIKQMSQCGGQRGKEVMNKHF